MTTLLGISKAAVSKVVMAYSNHGKSCTLKRLVSKNHGTTAVNLTAELIIHLEDPVSTKTV
jgi:predicted transcriptional regulator